MYVPDFSSRRELSLDELARLDEPACIYEDFYVDSDGVHAYIYTVAGWLDGQNVAVDQRGEFVGGCTVAGDVILIHAADRQAADAMAALGLEDTISMWRNNAIKQGSELSIEAAIRERLRH